MTNRIKESAICPMCGKKVGLLLVKGVKKFRMHEGHEKGLICWASWEEVGHAK